MMKGKVILIEAMVGQDDAMSLKAELEAVIAKHAALPLNTLVRNLQSGNEWNIESNVNCNFNGWNNECEIWEIFQQNLIPK